MLASLDRPGSKGFPSRVIGCIDQHSLTGFGILELDNTHLRQGFLAGIPNGVLPTIRDGGFVSADN